MKVPKFNNADIFKFGIAGLVVGVAASLIYSRASGGPADLSSGVQAAAMYNVMYPPLQRNRAINKITSGIPIEYQPEDPDVTWTMPDADIYWRRNENVLYNKTPMIPISARPAPDFRNLQPIGSIDKYMPGRTTYF